jgi:hypothetical protein
VCVCVKLIGRSNAAFRLIMDAVVSSSMVDLQLGHAAVIEQLVRVDSTSLPNSTNRTKKLAVAEYDDIAGHTDGGVQRSYFDQVAAPSAAERKEEPGLAEESTASVSVDLLQKLSIASSPSFDGCVALTTAADGMARGKASV